MPNICARVWLRQGSAALLLSVGLIGPASAHFGVDKQNFLRGDVPFVCAQNSIGRQMHDIKNKPGFVLGHISRINISHASNNDWHEQGGRQPHVFDSVLDVARLDRETNPLGDVFLGENCEAVTGVAYRPLFEPFADCVLSSQHSEIRFHHGKLAVYFDVESRSIPKVFEIELDDKSAAIDAYRKWIDSSRITDGKPRTLLGFESLVGFIEYMLGTIERLPLEKTNNDQAEGEKTKQALNYSIGVGDGAFEALPRWLFALGVALGLLASICVLIQHRFWLPACIFGLIVIGISCALAPLNRHSGNIVVESTL